MGILSVCRGDPSLNFIEDAKNWIEDGRTRGYHNHNHSNQTTTKDSDDSDTKSEASDDSGNAR